MANALLDVAQKTVTSYLSEKSDKPAWPGVRKDQVVSGLIDRLLDADLINQQRSPYCGPTAFWRSLLLDDPVAYVDAVLTLYQEGRAKVGDLVVKPGDATRLSPPKWGLDPVDWITLGGLRDSENSVFSAAGWFGDSAAGITIPCTLARWFRQAGYSEVKDHAAVTQGLMSERELWAHAQMAGVHQQQGYRVALFVDSDVLSTATQEDSTSLFPDHWIVLESSVGPAIPYYETAPVRARVFTWGKTRPLAEDPTRPVTEAGFVTKYYGYVAAKR